MMKTIKDRTENHNLITFRINAQSKPALLLEG